MKQGYKAEHWEDALGNPAGGCSFGTGFTISWQNGPLGRDEDRKEPNGAFVEDVIDAVKHRIEYYQQSEFACHTNALAIQALDDALSALESRTADREEREVEGTHAT